MPERGNQLSRRQFLEFVGASALGAGALLSAKELSRQPWFPQLSDVSLDVNNQDLLNTIRTFRVETPRTVLPHGLNGLYFNSPFIYNEGNPEEGAENHAWKDVVVKAKKYNGNRFRTFISTSFEPRFRQYNMQVLENIANFSNSIENYSDDAQEPAGLAICLLDSFPMGNCMLPNAIYGSSRTYSPYNRSGTWDEYERFFTDEVRFDYYRRRVETIVKTLKNNSTHISSWVPMNEPLPLHIFRTGKKRIPEAESVGILTDWYKKAVDCIRNNDAETPIVSGVANPWFINEEELDIDANSCHAYPFGTDFDRLSQYVKNPERKKPIDFEEVAYPLSIWNVKIPGNVADTLYANFVESLFVATSSIDYDHNTIVPEMTSFGVWHLSATHKDGFGFDDSLQKTTKLLQMLNNRVFMPFNIR
jgi:hypothetical protein